MANKECLGAITNFGSSFGLVACAGGNLSEERFSPRRPSKDFFTAVPAAGTAAVTAQKFLKGGVGGNSFQRVSLPPSSLEKGSNSRCDGVYAQFLSRQNIRKTKIFNCTRMPGVRQRNMVFGCCATFLLVLVLVLVFEWSCRLLRGLCDGGPAVFHGLTRVATDYRPSG